MIMIIKYKYFTQKYKVHLKSSFGYSRLPWI